jgi:hypothetical protein
MYVNNVDSISNKFKCGRKLSNYLIKRGFLLLSKSGNDYYFSDTIGLRMTLNLMSWWEKILYK